jgi:hypothetical protein
MSRKLMNGLRASIEDYNGIDGLFWVASEDELPEDVEEVTEEQLDDIADAFDGDIVSVGDTVAIAEDEIEDTIDDLEEADDLIDEVEEAVDETDDLADAIDCGTCSIESAEVMQNVMEVIANNRALTFKKIRGFTRADMKKHKVTLIPSMEAVSQNPSQMLRASCEGLVSFVKSVWGRIVDMQNNLSISLNNWLGSFGAYVKYAADLDTILLEMKGDIATAAVAAEAKSAEEILAGLQQDIQEGKAGATPEMFYLLPTNIPDFNADFSNTIIEAHDMALAAAYETVLAKIVAEAETDNQLVIESLLDNSDVSYDTINTAAREVLSRSLITTAVDAGVVPAGSILTRRAIYKSTSFNDSGIEPITSVLDDRIGINDISLDAICVAHKHVVTQLAGFGATGLLFGLTPGGLQQFVKDGYNILTDGVKDKFNTLQTLVVSVNPTDRAKLGTIPGEVGFIKSEVLNNLADEYDAQVSAAKRYELELSDENKVYATTITRGGIAYTDRSLIPVDEGEPVSGIILQVGGVDTVFVNTADVRGWASNIAESFSLAGFHKTSAAVQNIIDTIVPATEGTLTCISDLRDLFVSLVELASPVCGSIALCVTKFNPSLAILTIAEAAISAVRQLNESLADGMAIAPADVDIADTDSALEMAGIAAAEDDGEVVQSDIAADGVLEAQAAADALADVDAIDELEEVPELVEIHDPAADTVDEDVVLGDLELEAASAEGVKKSTKIEHKATLSAKKPVTKATTTAKVAPKSSGKINSKVQPSAESATAATTTKKVVPNGAPTKVEEPAKEAKKPLIVGKIRRVQ